MIRPLTLVYSSGRKNAPDPPTGANGNARLAMPPRARCFANRATTRSSRNPFDPLELPRAHGYDGRVSARPAWNPRTALPIAVAVLGVGLGAWLRLRGYSSLFLYGDELHSLPFSQFGWDRILGSYDPLGSGTALPLLQRISREIFGPDLWAFRLPTLIGGLGGLGALFFVARRLVGAPAAALATLALGLNTFHVYHSHFARSYSLAALAALVTVHALGRLTEPEPASARWTGVCVVSGGLIAYLHLTAGGLLVAAGFGATLALLFDGRFRRDGPRLLMCLGGAVLLAAILYFPAREPLAELLQNKSHNRSESLDFGFFDVATIFAGTSAAAAIWLVGVPASLVWMGRENRRVALLLGSAALLPIAIALVVRPVGGVHAYARYLLASLPFMLIPLAWALVEAGRRLLRSPARAETAAVGVGVCLLAVSHFAGPLGLANVGDGPFANMPHSMDAGAAPQDSPRVATPAFYARLAASEQPLRVIEAPALFNWKLLLYRNYYLQHRQQVWLGTLVPSRVDVLSGPYTPVREGLPHASGADYLILHLDIEAELRRSKGRTVSEPMRPLAPATVERLRRELGRTVYEDDDILVWKLRGAS